MAQAKQFEQSDSFNGEAGVEAIPSFSRAVGADTQMGDLALTPSPSIMIVA